MERTFALTAVKELQRLINEWEAANPDTANGSDSRDGFIIKTASGVVYELQVGMRMPLFGSDGRRLVRGKREADRTGFQLRPKY